jgi:lipopolysaccharide export system permease protein
MKLGSVIHRYIFRELLSPFFISLAFLLFVFLMTTLNDITEMVVNYRVSLASVLMAMLYNIPSFLQYIIPIAVMIGVLLTFLKMSSDNEIIAMKAGGMSIFAMLPPVLAFCLMGCLLTAFMSIYGEPWGKLSTKAMAEKLNSSGIAAFKLRKPSIDNNSFDNGAIYVGRVNPGQNTLENIFIEYQVESDQAFIPAPRGRLVGDSESQIYHLLLEDGQINRADIENQTVYAINFDTCRIRLDANRSLESSGKVKKEKEMTLGELREHLRTLDKKKKYYFKALTVYHSKFSIPFACFAMGILAVPLGVQSKSAKRSFGVGLGVFFFLGYYIIPCPPEKCMGKPAFIRRLSACGPPISLWGALVFFFWFAVRANAPLASDG